MMGCAAALVGSGLGRRVQETADSRWKGLKQAKRAFLHFHPLSCQSSRVYLQARRLRCSGNSLHTHIMTQLHAWIPSPSPEIQPPDTPRVITHPAIDTTAEFQGFITQFINI